MLTVHEAFEMLSDDELFKKWKAENKESYLCHCMRMLGDEDAWHIGYYNQDDSIQPFSITKDEVAQEKKDEVFKRPETKVKELDFSQVDLTATQAVKVALEFQQKEYAKEIPTNKQIVILQHIDEGQVYNITFITLAMSTLNIKVDAKTGDVVGHKRTSLMDFRQEGVSD